MQVSIICWCTAWLRWSPDNASSLCCFTCWWCPQDTSVTHPDCPQARSFGPALTTSFCSWIIAMPCVLSCIGSRISFTYQLYSVKMYSSSSHSQNQTSGERLETIWHLCATKCFLNRLALEWQALITRTHALRKCFVSVKGIYYQVLALNWAMQVKLFSQPDDIQWKEYGCLHVIFSGVFICFVLDRLKLEGRRWHGWLPMCWAKSCHLMLTSELCWPLLSFMRCVYWPLGYFLSQCCPTPCFLHFGIVE